MSTLDAHYAFMDMQGCHAWPGRPLLVPMCAWGRGLGVHREPLAAARSSTTLLAWRHGEPWAS